LILLDLTRAVIKYNKDNKKNKWADKNT
jgi:hypothetical protein